MLFFTGLSGSGKSTLARALMDLLLEQGGRIGDQPRRRRRTPPPLRRADLLQGGPRDQHPPHRLGRRRDRPPRRRGRLLARSRRSPRPASRCGQMVEDAGGAFFLVHVATPLEECERRDRKGLYAKARARRDPRVHRHLLALRGARGPGRARRHHRPHHRGRARRRAGRARRGRLPPPRPGRAGPPAHDRAAPVLFVCTANICRSPAMELIARDAGRRRRRRLHQRRHPRLRPATG